ncbi:molybdate ABC transporter substrate-binding protein [Arthrobacter sp. Br18]|uniref:molybdate ABC transporter substrate-binding protein n=1 Tax=Arthrobacter sp. Br18 TaxID=1312954 RepID=UPI0020A6645E|nr:molybdate ABC transporter substrate-binding protein [Arthrobacter sp. Br18]
MLPLSLSACAGPPGDDSSITVFAAASLRAPFTEVAEGYEAQNPGTTVVFSFAGSSDLATQLLEGAPADVFASADTRSMAALTEAFPFRGEPVVFATNSLEIAVPPGNPTAITSFADLADDGVRSVVCAERVPCGTATAALEEVVGVTLSPVSEESSVTDVLGKVSSGEADAGVVYATDVQAAAGAVEGIIVPEAGEVINAYPIAVLADSANEDAASKFAAYVLSTAGQAVLEAAGFGAP